MDEYVEKISKKFEEQLREYVELLVEMSVFREKYVDDIFSCLKGALGEYYKARFAEANNVPNPGAIAGWDAEVDEHFQYKFFTCVTRKTKGRYDRKTAFEEALEALRVEVPNELAHSRSQVAKAFNMNVKQLDYPPDAVTDEFFARAQNEFDKLSK